MLMQPAENTTQPPAKLTYRGEFLPEPPRNLMFIFLLLGLCLGSVYPFVTASGVFDSWEKLSTAPVQPATLLGTDSFLTNPGNVFVQVADGQVNAYNVLDKTWSTVQQYSLESRECGKIALRYWGIKRPFDAPYQCAQVSGHGDIGPPPQFIFVLDQDGTLYGWIDESTVIMLCVLPFFAGGGLLVGLVANFIWLFIRRLRLNRSTTPNAPERLAVRLQELKILRSIARFWSAGSIVLLWFEFRDACHTCLFDKATLLTGIFGMIFGWISPLPGGLIILAVFLLRLFVELNKWLGLFAPLPFLGITPYHSTISLIMEIISFLPGLLFLLVWHSGRKLKKEKQAAQVDL
jgi:hypothetical protein